MTELLATTDPTDRSNSPAIISRATGSEMIASSAAMLSQLATPPEERNCCPPKIAKNTNTSRVPTSAPVSGRRKKSPGVRWRRKIVDVVGFAESEDVPLPREGACVVMALLSQG